MDSNRSCRVDACDSPVGRHGAWNMCPSHYRRALTYGDPLHPVRDSASKFMPVEARFWRRVDRSLGSDGCWPWTGAVITARSGYGKFRAESGRTVYSHRFMWELIHGPVPQGMLVCHACDNPPCCNPAHLWLGTSADNTADMIAKGRQRFTFGRPQPTN